MNLHSLARTCPASRELLVRRITEQRWHVEDAAEAAGISTRTAYMWLARFRSDGVAGLRDRSSRPLRSPHATVCRILGRVGIARLRDIVTSPVHSMVTTLVAPNGTSTRTEAVMGSNGTHSRSTTKIWKAYGVTFQHGQLSMPDGVAVHVLAGRDARGFVVRRALPG